MTPPTNGVPLRRPPPRTPRKYVRRSSRQSPTLSAAHKASVAATAKILNARAVELRDALVEQAQRGELPKVIPFIEARGWPNESGIRGAFLERYGYPPRTYALAFRACPTCQCVAINASCETCARRAEVQGISR